MFRRFLVILLLILVFVLVVVIVWLQSIPPNSAIPDFLTSQPARIATQVALTAMP